MFNYDLQKKILDTKKLLGNRYMTILALSNHKTKYNKKVQCVQTSGNIHLKVHLYMQTFGLANLTSFYIYTYKSYTIITQTDTQTKTYTHTHTHTNKHTE